MTKRATPMMEFVLITFLVVLFLLVKALRHYGKGWLETRTGKGILAGVVLAPLAAIVLALALSLISGCAHVEDPYVEVYAGVESTKKVSPQCEVGGADDRLTSNLGVNLCGGVSDDGDTVVCAVYRHHSCAITEDREGYDAFGFQVSRRAYIR